MSFYYIYSVTLIFSMGKVEIKPVLADLWISILDDCCDYNKLSEKLIFSVISSIEQ